ncbi:hypothetical protein FQZ97_837380 [compost metagenome]
MLLNETLDILEADNDAFLAWSVACLFFWRGEVGKLRFQLIQIEFVSHNGPLS